jgi:uncharacterized protein (DUF488 family)
MPTVAALKGEHSLADLTRSLFGETLSLDEVFERVERVMLTEPTGLAPEATGANAVTEGLWVASVGYERHRHAAEFAQLLRRARIERLIDVRELPISRRRGYAKTALSEALAVEGIEYVHMRALGNPKPFRDLYKSGRVQEGRAAYERHLLDERVDALRELVPLLEEKRSALMCVEHDAAICHRAVIFDALRDEMGLQLDVIEVR